MGIAEDTYEELKNSYEGQINFKRICDDRGILAVKTKLEDGVNGFSIVANGHKLIVLNESLTPGQRRDWAFHELFHILKSPSFVSTQYHANKREEDRANLFAALCRVPSVRDNETIETLCDRTGITPILAKIRLDHELMKLNR